MTLSVACTNLSKAYGKTQAIHKLNLEVEAGTIYGLIGPNGAGKTTSLAILAGLLKPTSGNAWILGEQARPGCRWLASKVGFSSPQFPLFDYLTGLEMLAACGFMHGLPSRDVNQRIEDLLELLDLQSVAGEYLSHYSQGMRQKAGLACAIIHAPDVLFLDEPFLGLDPASIYGFIGILEQMAAKGRTVVISSHNIDIIERLCSRVGILHRGILQREIVMAAEGTHSEESPCKSATHSRLESVLWEVMGPPKPKELHWI
jgi:ABC-2 type transport system ATP-binding protein